MSGTSGNRGDSKGIPAPFSLRLTFEERAALEKAAGNMPLGAYIRSMALQGNDSHKRRRRRRPIKDHEALGYVLGEPGKSRIANNLILLAKAVHTGSLPITPDTEKMLRAACSESRKCAIC